MPVHWWVGCPVGRVIGQSVCDLSVKKKGALAELTAAYLRESQCYVWQGLQLEAALADNPAAPERY